MLLFLINVIRLGFYLLNLQECMVFHYQTDKLAGGVTGAKRKDSELSSNADSKMP